MQLYLPSSRGVKLGGTRLRQQTAIRQSTQTLLIIARTDRSAQISYDSKYLLLLYVVIKIDISKTTDEACSEGKIIY